jgi:hypothetical protein
VLLEDRFDGIEPRKVLGVLESEASYDQAIKISHKEIGQIESTWLSFAQVTEYRLARKKFVAMSPRYPFNTVFLKHLIQLTAGSAIGIRDKNMFVVVTVLLDLLLDRVRDFSRRVMQLRGEALYFYVIPLIAPLYLDQFPSQCPTGNEQSAGCHFVDYDARR